MTAHPDVGAAEGGPNRPAPLTRFRDDSRGPRVVARTSPVVARLRRAAPALLLAGFDLTAFGIAFAASGRPVNPTDLGWVALTVLLFTMRGAYRTRLTFSILSDAPSLAGRCVAAGALAGVLVQPLGVTSSGEGPNRILSVTLVVLLSRGLVYAAIRALRRGRLVEHRTLVIGAGIVGAQIARTAVDHPEFGLRPVGFLDARPLLPDHELAVPVIGDTHDLGRIIREREIEHVIVAFAQGRESDAVDLIRTCDRLEVEIFFVPRLFELSAMHGNMDELLGLPLVRLRRATFRTFGWRVKRLFDVVVAVLALGVLILPMIVIAVALRLAHGPGVIFRQERLGLDGRAFRLAKFRTLRVNATDEGDVRWSIQNDSRLDSLGRFLRRWSLDELPQLVNILRGDMSLVGPRPERPHFVAEFASAFPRYVARHRVPCGLTGWAQIHGLRGDTSIEERVRFDNYYIENWSLWLDIKIIFRTLLAFRKGG